MLNLRRIEALMEVAERGSFSAAADALNFTQSAISQQIAALEQQVGVTLLTRNPISLTEAGEVLCKRAAEAIGQLRAAEVELENLKGMREGTLRLATFASAGSALMPAAIGDFCRRYPGISVTLSQHEVAESEARLRGGELDLALTFDYSVAPAVADPLLTRHLVVCERVFVAIPPRHRLARVEVVRLDDLAGEPWIQAVNAGLALELLSEAAGVAAFEPEVTFEGDDFETVLGLVRAGLGVAVIPQLALGREQSVAIRPIKGDPLTRSIYATTLATSHGLPSVLAMQVILEDTVGRLTVRDPVSTANGVR